MMKAGRHARCVYGEGAEGEKHNKLPVWNDCVLALLLPIWTDQGKKKEEKSK